MKLEEDSLRCVCGRWARPAQLRIEGMRLAGWRCPSCGEEYLTPESSQQLSDYKRVQTAASKATVAKVGNSLAIRIRKEVASALGLQPGTKLRVHLASPKRLELQLA